MVAISSYGTRASSDRSGWPGSARGWLGLSGVAAPLTLAAALVGLVVDGVRAGARSTAVTGDALILSRWRSMFGALSDSFAGQLGPHCRGCPSRSDYLVLPCSSRGWHQAGCERGVRTVLRSPR